MQIILHIGQQKTGSTLIQADLKANRKNLATQGILYPAALGNLHPHLHHFIENSKKLHAPRETIIRDLRAEFSGQYRRVVLSDETIYRFSNRNKRALKRFFGDYATSWRVLCYLRRPDEHIVSDYQQEVRHFDGRQDDFDSFYAERLYSNYYRYSLHMDRWAEVFGQENVEVRVFHRTILQGSPTQDFLRWIGVDPEMLSLQETRSVNESFDRVNTQIMRFLYRCQTRHPELVRGHDIRKIERKLQALNTSDRLRLDYERAKRLHERFRKDHEQLAERYLSSEQAAILLAPSTETAPQPPIQADVLFERMMAAFADPALAQLAVKELENGAKRDQHVARRIFAAMVPQALTPIVRKARRLLRVP